MLFNFRYIALAALVAGGFVFSPLLVVATVRAAETAAVASPSAPQAAAVEASAPAATSPTIGGPGSPAGGPSCIPDWSVAGPIVRREGLATIERVGRLARDKEAVEIVTSTLCKTQDGYIYRLTVRGGQNGGKFGGLRTLIVDARQPFGQ